MESPAGKPLAAGVILPRPVLPTPGDRHRPGRPRAGPGSLRSTSTGLPVSGRAGCPDHALGAHLLLAGANEPTISMTRVRASSGSSGYIGRLTTSAAAR